MTTHAEVAVAARNGAKYGGISGGVGGVVAALVTAFVTSFIYADRTKSDIVESISGIDKRVAVIEGNLFTAVDASEFAVLIAQLNGRLDTLNSNLMHLHGRLATIKGN